MDRSKAARNLLTAPLFVKMLGPVGQCALELPAQNKKMIPGLKWPSHAHLAFFSFVCDVMNSHL